MDELFCGEAGRGSLIKEQPGVLRAVNATWVGVQTAAGSGVQALLPNQALPSRWFSLVSDAVHSALSIASSW